MNRFIMAYHNFVTNDLATCKKVGNGMGIFFILANMIQNIMYIGKMPFILWCIIAIASMGVSFITGYLLGIIPSSVLYYLVEVVSPRKEKSYLPNETKEE
jgi:MFS superfamily sulfate permease-like transporter